ncbi:hypothetical protein [Candidatus Methanoprimaticola sp. MG2]|uniref:hypothetical protein n=1 Tax=Candidatus Methanoprimaticola sp. MG2 TaxID=3228838 RepID=UPI0039C5E6FD
MIRYMMRMDEKVKGDLDWAYKADIVEMCEFLEIPTLYRADWDTNPKNDKYAGWFYHSDIFGIKINDRYKGGGTLRDLCVQGIIWHELCHYYTEYKYGFTGHGKEFIKVYLRKPLFVLYGFLSPFLC